MYGQGDNTGKDMEVPTGDPAMPTQSVLDLLAQCKKEFEPFLMAIAPTAELNERYFHGDQYGELANGAIIDNAWAAGMPQVTRNLIRSLVLTWSSRIMEDRPNVKAWPGDAGFVDAAAVDMANSYLEYQRQLQDLDAMLSRAAILAQVHSCVGFKVFWDPSKGPERTVPTFDELGIETGCECVRLGEINIKVCTVFDFFIDPVEHAKDAQWVVFCSLIDVSEARARLRAAGIKDAVSPQNDKVSNAMGPRKGGIEAYEIWHLPTPEMPDGLYAVVVDGNVTEATAYPYAHEELPISVWKVNDKRNSPHGTTHMDDAVPVQRKINEGLAVATRLNRNVGQYVKAIVTSALKDQWESDDQILTVDAPEQAQIIRWLEPPMASIKFIQEQVAIDEQALYQVFGLNEMLTGAANAKSSTSGKAIQYLKSLDSQKLAHSARNLGECVKRMMSQVLQLAQQYMSDERMLAIAGEDGGPEVMAFRASSLKGVDVRLESHSGYDLMRDAKAGKVPEQLQMGMINPQQAQEMQRYGTDAMRLESMHRAYAQEQIGQVLHGAFVQPDPNLDSRVAQEEISQAIGVYQHENPQAAWQLFQLLNGYRALAQQPQQPQQPNISGGPNVPQG